MLNIRKAGHRELETYYSLFEVDFDKAELMPKLAIHKGLLNGSWELLIIYEEESQLDLAYALVGTKNMYGYVLLKYFAVLPWYRDKGLGIEIMRMLNKRYADRQGIIAELTEFEDDYPNHLKKLMRYFNRFGYEEIESDYHIGGTKAHIFVKPMKSKSDISPVAHRIIPDFYSNCMSTISLYNYMDIKRVGVLKKDDMQ